MNSFFNFSRTKEDPFDQLNKYTDLDDGMVLRLREFSRKASPFELFRANPAFLVDKLGMPLPKVLDLLTYAAAEQLWHFDWQVNCPGCGGEIQNEPLLSHIHPQAACSLCDWKGEVRLDREVNVYASASSRVRSLDDALKDDPLFRDRQDLRHGRIPAVALINRPIFRELMGEQTLPNDSSLGVQHMVVFFSDLRSSTGLYQRRGDADAYRLVREHFTTIFDAVDQNGGSAVKTMGDGVMSTFFNNASALRGIQDAVRGIHDLNRRLRLGENDRLQLKIGLHAGPCLVVTLNHRLDYFGSTVNIASRFSSLAEGNDLIVSASLLEDAEARKAVQEMGVVESITANLRGVGETIPAYRVKFS